MIAIPNMDKPQNITRCSYKINPEECKCVYTDKVFEETLALILDHPCPDCPLIDIVTCGECKHWYNDADCGMACEFTNMKQPSDGFCNWGERRNG
jgi:hypothetical protein